MVMFIDDKPGKGGEGGVEVCNGHVVLFTAAICYIRQLPYPTQEGQARHLPLLQSQYFHPPQPSPSPEGAFPFREINAD